MKNLRVLFLGNSHTFFHDMPQIFKTLAEAGQDVSVEVTMLTEPGMPLSWHVNQTVNLRHALIYGNYDYLVVQQGAHPFPPEEDTMRDGATIAEWARKCGTTPIFCMTWAEKRAPEHQAKMDACFTKLAKELDVDLEVTGPVFERASKELPEISLHFYDGEHCSPYGSYVRALAVYACIFKESPVGLPACSLDFESFPIEEASKLDPILRAMDEKPGDEELLGQYMAAFGHMAYLWDKEEMKVDLDPEVAKTLQEWVWEAYQKYNG